MINGNLCAGIFLGTDDASTVGADPCVCSKA